MPDPNAKITVTLVGWDWMGILDCLKATLISCKTEEAEKKFKGLIERLEAQTQKKDEGERP